MKTRSIGMLAVCGVLSLLLVGGPAANAGSSGQHCAYRLVPESRPRPHVISARPVLVGCFDTFSESIEAGSHGSVVLPRTTAPQDLNDTLIAEHTVLRGRVIIGTEWNGSGFSGASKSFMAADTCAGTTYEFSYVGDDWNDRGQSGKGFGGCDTNKKFVHSNYGGDVLTCTPNCNDYGTLNNEVSSLRYKP
jgi:hypothetical protein